MLRAVLLAITSMVAAASFAPDLSAQTVVVLGLVAAAALRGVHAAASVPDATLRSLRPPRRSAAVPLVLAAHTTDVVHHPVRPRAPGLV